MKLVRFVGRGFRNLRPFELDTDARFVVVTGANGQGKTNLLEAVWYLSTLRPLRTHRSRELIGWDDEVLGLSGWIEERGQVHHHRLDLSEKGPKLQVDKAEVRDLATWFGGLRAIAFTPQDGAILTEGPQARRAWLDRAAFTAHPSHLEVVRSFGRALKQKSTALRQGMTDATMLDVYDDQVAQHGAVLAHRRALLLEELRPHIARQHEAIAAGQGELGFVYRSAAAGRDVAERKQTLLASMAKARATEIRRRMVMVGPQKDELVVTLDDRAIRSFGSRGQVRSVVLAMKLAELIAAHGRGDHPLFLLDDLSSELDRQRTARLVQQLDELGSQVWVTTTDAGHLGRIPRDDVRHLQVQAGVIASVHAPPVGVREQG